MKQHQNGHHSGNGANGAAPPHGQPLIVAAGVSKSYPRVQALAPLSFTAGEGERIALVGPSGSGKTTLLYLLAGIIQPTQGQVSIAGRNLAELQPGRDLARLVGIIHQQFDLVPHLPVIHNVLAGRLGEWGFFRSLVSLMWPQERQLAASALRQLGIGDKLRERTVHLSGGEQQRVAIARVIAQSPQVILADEPVASLDPARAEDLMRILSDLARNSGKTLIASIHSPYLIQRYFSRAIGLRAGRLQFDLPASQVSEATLEALYDLKPAPAEAPAAVP